MNKQNDWRERLYKIENHDLLEDFIEKEIEKAEKRGAIKCLHKMTTRIENCCPLNNPSEFQAGHLKASKYLLDEIRDLEEELKQLKK